MENSNYLGTEKVGKLLWQFAIPCICSLIISCLYNIVDQIFVGNGVGYLGNAATGVIFPITVVGWGLSLFFGDGAAAALSVSLGRGETKDIHKSVGVPSLGHFFPDRRRQFQTEYGAAQADNGLGDFKSFDTAFHRGHYGCQQYTPCKVWRTFRLWRRHSSGGICGHYEAIPDRTEYRYRNRRRSAAHRWL